MADETTAAQGVINLFPGLENTDSFVINAFDMHMVFIIFLGLTSLVGLYIVITHYNKLFVRWKRLAVAFAFIFGIALGETLEHTDLLPGGHFWHYVHLASGVVALYFLYAFTSKWDFKQPEDKVRVLGEAVLAAVIMLGSLYALFSLEAAGNVDIDAILFVTLTLITLFILAKTWTNISRLNASLQNTFSLKVFLLTSALYGLVAVLFLLVLDVDFMGTALTTLGHNPYTTLARIFQNMLYVVLSATMMAFAFVTMRADKYYAPIASFLSQAKKKGK